MLHKKYPNKRKSSPLRRRFSRVAVFGLTALGIGVAAAILAVFESPKVNHAAPYLGCSPSGYILKDSGGNSDIQAIDMVTGKGSAAGTVNGKTLNAIGYSPRDNHFYAWDLAASQYVKLDANFNVVATFSTTDVAYTGPSANDIFAGDVDEDGFHWFFRVVGGTTFWYKIDTNQATPKQVLAGSGANPTDAPDTLSEGTDWAYVPGTNKLYRGMDNGASITIVAFDRNSHSYSVVGKVTNITAGGAGGRNMGAVYADPNGNFYMSSHGSGILWRVDLDNPSNPSATPPEYTAVQLDAADINSNDGARCSLASVPTDYSDAPSSYKTTIDDDGPRHNVIGFNVFNSSAALMLGQKVDLENDGFPNANATGDDDDHQGIPGSQFVDDERGVQSIVATPTSSDPLTVPVYVTNGTGQAATLVGWIDLDRDGTFEASERVSTNVPHPFSGHLSLTFPAPSSPYTDNTFARFRLFAANDTSDAAVNLLPTGPATGGEVEDVQVQVGSYDVTKSANPNEGSTVDSGAIVTYTLAIKNTGATPLTNLKIDDDLRDVLDDATLEGTPTVNPSSAGSATVSGNTLEFAGDIGLGSTVTVTYKVKVKASGTLGNASLKNYVLAAHSTSCHPQVSNGGATVNDPDCQTEHKVNGLANTGTGILLPLVISGGLLTVAGVATYVGLRGKGRLLRNR